MSEHRQFDSLEASELYCPKCKGARPVRQHLLLILPTGKKYDYRCSVCASSLGSKMDEDRAAFSQMDRESDPGHTRS